MNPSELIAAARELLSDSTSGAGGWPRMAALLTRQALEKALNEFWETHPNTSGLSRCTRKSQLTCLPFYLDPVTAREVTYLWAVLSEACHYHVYELAPTASELTRWIDTVSRLVAAMREKEAGGSSRPK